MQTSTMVNFRISNERYRSWQREARRRSLSLSAFLRNCIDDVCARAAVESQAKSSWRESLPAEVGELVGMLPSKKSGMIAKARKSVAKTDKVNSDRDDYYEHLEEKYA